MCSRIEDDSMSWLDWLRGRPAPDSTEPATPPVRIEIVPSALNAYVHVHAIAVGNEPIPCWTYVTNGLSERKQKEIVFTLRRNRGEPAGGFPRDPLDFFKTLYELAGQGSLVDVGGFTQFAKGGVFDRHLAYLEAQPLSGVGLPKSALVAVLVTLDEVLALRSFGATRLISRLGHASRYYPFPPWSDRQRRGVPFERVFKESLLAKVSHMIASGFRVHQSNNQIRMSVPRKNCTEWRRSLSDLPANAAFAWCTGLGPDADGCLVWEPGQRSPAAISPPGSTGSRIAGCFVMIVPEQTADGGRVFEDGFGVMLTAPSSAAVRRGLLEGHDVSIPGSADGMSFTIEWRDD
jgi:Domain of unknown function (DUF3480)